jgi:hypothetical protein
MEKLQAFQAAAHGCGFVSVEECEDGTVLWLRRATPDAVTATHQRMCMDSATNSVTVYWMNDRERIDSKTFRDVATLQAWFALRAVACAAK